MYEAELRGSERKGRDCYIITAIKGKNLQNHVECSHSKKERKCCSKGIQSEMRPGPVSKKNLQRLKNTCFKDKISG